MKGRPGRELCKVPGCGRFVKSHGYCDGHNCQIKKYGKIIRIQLGVFEKKYCIVEGCGEPVKARGYCSRHSAQFYAHGKIISAEKIKEPNGNRKCSVEGCDRKHRANGYCTGHLGQFRKHGKIIKEKLDPRIGIMRVKSRNGEYILIKKPDHVAANKDGYVKRANLVWEEKTGQVVVPPALLHHKNGIKNDDSFENLEYFPSDHEHQKAHHVREGIKGFIPGGIY